MQLGRSKIRTPGSFTTLSNSSNPDDLRGGKRAARRLVDWHTFFNFGAGNFRPNKRMDGKLSTPLMLLPGSRGAAPGLPADGV
jgi:hypothetical protein